MGYLHPGHHLAEVGVTHGLRVWVTRGPHLQTHGRPLAHNCKPVGTGQLYALTGDSWVTHARPMEQHCKLMNLLIVYQVYIWLAGRPELNRV